MNRLFGWLSILSLIFIPSIYSEQETLSLNQELFCLQTDYDKTKQVMKMTLRQGGENDLAKQLIFYITFDGEMNSEVSPLCQKPILVEEKLWDPIAHQEILVSTRRNTYSENNELIRIELKNFQTNQNFCIDYDENERPLLAVDQNGNQIPLSELVDLGILKASDLEEELVFQQAASSENAFQSSINGPKSLMSFINDHVKEELKVVSSYRDNFKEVADKIFGRWFLLSAGYYNEKTTCGIVGKGELSDKVRVTHINGILNLKEALFKNVSLISRAHGNVNVHYVHRATYGWTWDILNCVVLKLFGYPSSEASELVKVWRELIAEMKGEGIIFHYAHSVGGIETYVAGQQLTADERKMIKVVTLGSPLLFQDDGFGDVQNYVNKHDFVSLFDPVRYLKAKTFDGATNIIFSGDWSGIPGADHLIQGKNYTDLIESLGIEFVKVYGSFSP